MLECRGLGFSRTPQQPILADVCLQVSAGQVLKVVGANGSGKTTLLKLLCGLLPADSGGVYWQGEDIANAPDTRDDFYDALHYVGHRNGVADALTPLENLQAIAAARTAPARQPFGDALQAAGLAAEQNRLCETLSSGQKRRAALARLRAFPAQAWVLDEPNASLDQTAKAMLADWIAEHTQAGGCAVVSMHHRDDWQLENAQHYHCH